MIRVGIVGATGYTGRELVRLMLRHPRVSLTALTSESHAGKYFADIYPEFTGLTPLKLESFSQAALAIKTDFIFSALPHGLSLEKIPLLLQAAPKVVDLSGDYRLKEATLYEEWYGYKHGQETLLGESVYGLPEVNRAAIRSARLVANPGCYPTSALLALKPLLNRGVLDTGDIIIDSKSGVSGAGRTPALPFHYPEVNENFKAYKVVGHQHTPEIEEQAAFLAGGTVTLNFTPHLIPMTRGILSTLYLTLKAKLSQEELLEFYQEDYKEEPFVRLRMPPALPETRFVWGSNFCDISLRLDERTGRLIVISAIDNLVKGAAGQAVQNFNIMQGFLETEGLI